MIGLLLKDMDEWVLIEDRDVLVNTRGQRCMGYYLRIEMYGL